MNAYDAETQRRLDAVEEAKAVERATVHAWNLLLRRAPISLGISILPFVVAVQQSHAGIALTVSLVSMFGLWLYAGWCAVTGQVTCPKTGYFNDTKLRPEKVTRERLEAERKLSEHLLRGPS